MAQTVIFFGLMVLATSSEYSRAREFVIVGTPQALFRSQSNDQLRGIDVDVVKLVMAEMNIEFRIELLYSNKRIQHQAKHGKVDMVLSYSQTAERLTYLDYPKVSYKDISWHFFALKDNPRQIHFHRYQDLKGISIGADRDASYTEAFWQADLSLVLVSNNELLLGMLLKKRVELIPMNKMNLRYQAQQIGRAQDLVMLPKPIKNKAYYNPFPKASSYPNRARVMRRYDEILQKLKADGQVQEIYQRYLGNLNSE